MEGREGKGGETDEGREAWMDGREDKLREVRMGE